MSNTTKKSSGLDDEIEVTTKELLILGAILGGVAGGIAFGVLMAISVPNFGMFRAISSLFLPIEDPLLGIGIHIVISVIFGTIFGLFLIWQPKTGENLITTTISGIIYGFILWVVAGQFLFIIIAERDLFAFTKLFDVALWISTGALQSFVGHVIYGLFLGIVTWYMPTILEKLGL